VSIVVFLSNLVGSAFVSSVSFLQDSGDLPATEPLPQSADKIKELSETLNQTQAVQEVSAGILEPIYRLAELMSHPSFYWIAFVVMVAGVVSFAGQLVFTKLLLLFKLKLNIKEILGDLLGLVVSLTGLVLTTQAAAQNSTFPENAVAVVSATIVGAIVGFVFYLWGQSQEFQAARQAPKTDDQRRRR
jgi:drug/metabolite transporter (DMT)-like permease